LALQRRPPALPSSLNLSSLISHNVLRAACCCICICYLLAIRHSTVPSIRCVRPAPLTSALIWPFFLIWDLRDLPWSTGYWHWALDGGAATCELSIGHRVTRGKIFGCCTWDGGACSEEVQIIGNLNARGKPSKRNLLPPASPPSKSWCFASTCVWRHPSAAADLPLFHGVALGSGRTVCKSRNRLPLQLASTWLLLQPAQLNARRGNSSMAIASRCGHPRPPAHPKPGSCCGPHK
jgi:hypothetical protein